MLFSLAAIKIFCLDGTLAPVAGVPFAGLSRFAARTLVVEKLQAKGLYRGKEGHATRLGICSRSGDVIEPMLLPQWCVTFPPPSFERDEGVSFRI